MTDSEECKIWRERCEKAWANLDLEKRLTSDAWRDLSALRIERATLVEENADLRAKLGEQVAFNTQVDRLHDRVARLVAERDALRAALKRLVDIAGEIDEDEHLDVYKTLTLRERVKEARAALTPKKED